MLSNAPSSSNNNKYDKDINTSTTNNNITNKPDYYFYGSSLSLFGIKSNIAIEDLIIPSIIEIIIYIPYIVAIIIYKFYLTKCQTHGFNTYIDLVIFFFILFIVINILTIYLSFKSKFLHPNNSLIVVFYFRALIFLFFVLFNVFGSLLLTSKVCLTGYYNLTLFLTIFNWIIIIFTFILAYCATSSFNLDFYIKYFKCLTFLNVNEQTFASTESGLRILYNNLQKLFSDMKDIVFSDVMLGLLLVKDLQSKQVEYGKKFLASYSHEIESRRRGSDLSDLDGELLEDTIVDTCINGFQPRLNQDEWDDIKGLQYYMKFSEAVYGWSQYIFANPFQLFNLCGCCILNCRDNQCSCNLHVFLRLSNIKSPDILYYNSDVNVAKVVYYVVNDEVSKSLVIAIRGTLSLEDCMTCSNAEPYFLKDFNLSDSYSHSGIVTSANNIFNFLESKMIISGFLKFNPNYRVVTCGHSLGAGTASVLALILKQKYDSTLCFAYGCPLIFDKKLSKKTSAYITSVSFSNDIICRLSPKSMYTLKEKMKWCFKNSKLSSNSSKWEYLSGINTIDHRDLFSHLTRIKVLDAQSDFSLNEGGSADIIVPVDDDKPMPESLPLYPPGKMYYILPGNGNSTVVFRSGYNSFAEIVISLDMVKDHFPYIYSKALNDIKIPKINSNLLY